MKNVEKLKKELNNLEIFKKFQIIKEKIENNQDLIKKIDDFKKYQRSLVLANKCNINRDEKYTKMKEDIFSEYLMIEYNNALEEINLLISLITDTISFNL